MPPVVSSRVRPLLSVLLLALGMAPQARAGATTLPERFMKMRGGMMVLADPAPVGDAATGSARTGQRPPAKPATLVATGWSFEPNIPGAQVGNGFTSVATLGDVNGDGYSDFAVGAPNYVNGQPDEGAVYVFYGAAGGPPITPSWQFESNKPSAYLGATVAPAGDVNGDGYADLIVGAPGLTQGLAGEGKAYVFLGGPAGLAATPAWSAAGGQAGANFGTCVATAGDVNGDGYDDVIVGANGFDNGLFDRGKAFVYLGSAAGLAVTPAWTYEGPGQGDGFGWSVATAGDVNGDGFADVIVGAPFTTVSDRNSVGIVYVFAGSATGLGLAPFWTWTGPIQAGAEFGFSAAGIGDSNGDGYADFAVGAPGYDDTQADQGQVSVFAGGVGPGGIPGVLWVQSGPLSFISHGAQYGYSLNTAGDVNGDGYADLVVGAPTFTLGNPAGFEKGWVSLYQGGPVGTSPIPTWTAFGADRTRYGQCVATAGDPDIDGFSDVLIGAPGYTNGEPNEGIAYLWRGVADLPPTTPSWSFTHAAPDTGAFSMPSYGDFDGDGYGDLVCSRNVSLVPSNTAAQLVVFRGGLLGLASVPSQVLTAPPGEAFIWARNIHDVNGDGYDDAAVITITDADSTQHTIRVLPGGAGGLGSTPVWSKVYPSDGTYIKIGVGADVNGDGLIDLVVPVLKRGLCAGCYENHLETFLGTPTGLSTLATSTTPIVGSEAFGQFNLFISVGDFDGDGRGDVAVGDFYYSGSFSQEGGAWLYNGSSAGLSATPSQTFTGGAVNASRGFLGAFGDVNGDGYADFGIARLGVTPSEVEVHYGNAALPVQTLTGPLGFGEVAGNAADVNGDGYSDAVISTLSFNPPDQLSLFLGGPSGLSALPNWQVSGTVGQPFSFYFATDGDVNGDGFSDIVNVDASYPFESLKAYYGNGGQGLDRIPQQFRADASAPVGLLGRSGDANAFEVHAKGRSAAGRTRVRLQSEARTWGTAFDVAGLASAAWTPLGAPLTTGTSVSPLSVHHSGLASLQHYKWRARIASASPYFPWTPWLSPQGNGREQHDLRTSPLLAAGVSVPGATTRELRLAPPSPNPFRTATTLSFTLPERARVSLGVYDISGRRVALLVNSARDAGAHHVEWDGRSDTGKRTGDGIYFVRFVSRGEIRTQKLVMVR